MCTTMRRLRRRTDAGIALKLMKRRVTVQIKRLTSRLQETKSPDEVEGLMTRVLNLRRIRKAIKI